MKDYHPVQDTHFHDESPPSLWGTFAQGQAMVEYALILVLVALAFGTGLAATAPAISRAFERTVYSLLGEDPEPRVGGGPADFWLTVTWVAENPPEQRRIPTRTLAPPSATPTEFVGTGPGGETDDDLENPMPGGNNPIPTATRSDVAHSAPWQDSVNAENVSWYRVGDAPFLGYSDWRGEYYTGIDLGTTPALEAFNSVHYGSAARGVLRFPNAEYSHWANDAMAPVSGWENTNYSIRFIREIYIPPVDPEGSPIPLQFNLTSSDGARVWLFPRIDEENYENQSTCPTGCLLINNWGNTGLSSTSIFAPIPPGRYRIQVDYRQIAGASILNFDVTTSENPDDQLAANARCNWGQRTTNDANTLTRLWDQRAGEAGRNTTCYLELRGYINIPATMANPQFAFWDVWDIGNQQAAWFEIAEYVPISAESPRVINRDAIVWYRVPVHSSQTLNYNWTRHEYDLTALNAFRVNPDGSLGAQEVVNFSGRNVTFRMAFSNGATGNTLWVVDDIEIVSAASGTYGATIGLNTQFELNSADQRNYFVTTGQWALTSANTAPSSTGLTGCCSWELNPNAPYTKFSESPELPLPSTERRDQDMRIHYVQLRPFIDVDLATADQEGDEGAPMLSFWHHYDIGSYVGLEIQYRVPGGEWTVVPGPTPSDPAGRLVNIQTNTSNAFISSMTPIIPVDVSLEYIPEPIYQLRFAMLVHRANAVQGGGWWIDNIKLHREDRARFLDYPFFDNAESGSSNWTVLGSSWQRTNEYAYSGSHSFVHQPTGSASDVGSQFALVYPIDLNNDTPRPSQDQQGNTGGAAVRPYLTFWNRREIPEGSHLYVEWRRIEETDSQWKPLWTHQSWMGYIPGTGQRSFVNLAWEFVEISLEHVMSQISAANTEPYTDDDILIRFRIEGTTDATRWYIDDVRVQEYSETSHRLWTGENGTYGAGDGTTFLASPDLPGWASMWRLGGDWRRISWETQSGIAAFHDSVGTGAEAQTSATDGIVVTRGQTQSVLELTRIVDLQATPATLNPTLYFWSRLHTGYEDRLRIQVAYELRPADVGNNMVGHMTSDNRCRGWSNNRPQCYDQLWGWSRWYDVMHSDQNNSLLSNGWNSTQTNRRHNSWQRYQVNLSNIRLGSSGNRIQLTQNGANPGRRIRIRFVVDAYENPSSTRQDGWYLDNISIEPRRDSTIATIADAPFFDNASDGMMNWVGEGLWSVDHTYKVRINDISTTLGTWTEYFWDAVGHSGSQITNQLNNNQYPATNLFTGGSTSSVRYNVVDIFHDHDDYGSPRPGTFEKTPTGDGNRRGMNYAARWVLDTPVISSTGEALPGIYRFQARADDGVRLKVEELNSSGNVISGTTTWVIGRYNHGGNGWQDQGATNWGGTYNMVEGKRYRLTLEYYQGGGGAFLSLSIVSPTNSNSFGASPSITPPITYANSSLILDGTIDLRGTTNPVIEYYVAYELGCNSSLRFEVSRDGGYTWTQSDISSTSGLPAGTAIDNATITTATVRHTVNDSVNDLGWRLMRHSLRHSNYRNANPGIMIRFRFDRQNATAISSEDSCSSSNNNGLYIGAWISDIRIVDIGG
jgi:Flp pilus assembly pilin Flp